MGQRRFVLRSEGVEIGLVLRDLGVNLLAQILFVAVIWAAAKLRGWRQRRRMPKGQPKNEWIGTTARRE